MTGACRRRVNKGLYCSVLALAPKAAACQCAGCALPGPRVQPGDGASAGCGCAVRLGMCRADVDVEAGSGCVEASVGVPGFGPLPRRGLGRILQKKTPRDRYCRGARVSDEFRLIILLRWSRHGREQRTSRRGRRGCRRWWWR